MKNNIKLSIIVNLSYWLAILFTALAPSMIACFANSPGRSNFTADWISLAERVCFLLYLTSLEASIAIFSKISPIKL